MLLLYEYNGNPRACEGIRRESKTRRVSPQLLRENLTKKMYFMWQSTFGTFYYNLDSSTGWILLYCCSLTWTNLEKHKWVILSDNYSQRRSRTNWHYILSLGHQPQILLWSVKHLLCELTHYDQWHDCIF